MKKEIKFLAFFLLLSNLSLGQTNVRASELLRKFWKLDNTYLKYKSNSRFNYYKENKISFIDVNNENSKISHTESALDFYFISDSIFNFLTKNEYYKQDSLLTIFFKLNRNVLLKDTLLDSFTDHDIKVVHLKMDNDKIFSASLNIYKFYNFKSFSQLGYPWSSGQPQMGYVYDEASNLPKTIIEYLKRNNIIPFRKISSQKTYIYSETKSRSKSYLIKDDEVEILEEKDNWLKIRYYGQKIVEGWIKKSDVE